MTPETRQTFEQNFSRPCAKSIGICAGELSIPQPRLVFPPHIRDDADMHLEHLGLNHPDPVAAAAWYCQNLGMTVARKFGPPQNGRFLADARGKMMLEFYHNTEVDIPEYATFAPFSFHIAFHVTDVAALRDRLLQAGARPEGEVNTNSDGDQITIVRDPWGICLQFVQRAKPMV
jgi:catechol 2,3-dioxygenase-like lactoylglutathione lyase family enzyme